MLNVKKLEAALLRLLSPDQADQAAQLARLLADASNDAEDGQTHTTITTDSELLDVLASLAGQKIDSQQATVQFGSGNQIGNVTIRDIVRGNVISITITNPTLRHPILNKRSKRWSSMLIFSVVGFLILGLAFGLIATIAERKTDYFVIDTSSPMTPWLETITTNAALRAIPAARGREVGMAVFGGNLSDIMGCGDVSEVLPPEQQSIAEITTTLDRISKVRSRSQAGIQEAVTFALERLAGRRGDLRVILITGNLLRNCAPLSREALDSLASSKNIRYTLTIITVGEVSPEDQELLRAFARDNYIHAGTTTALPEIIQSILSNNFYEPYLRYSY